MPNGAGGGIVGWPVPFIGTPLFNNNSSLGFSANQVNGTGFALPYSLRFSQVQIAVATADAVGLYDIGLYTQAGVLVANVGAQHLPSTGLVNLTMLQGTQTIQPGMYFFALTGNAATALLWYNNAGSTWKLSNNDIASSSGGTLPNSISAITAAPTDILLWFLLF